MGVKGDYLGISVDGRLGVRVGDILSAFCLFISQTLYCGSKEPKWKGK